MRTSAQRGGRGEAPANVLGLLRRCLLPFVFGLLTIITAAGQTAATTNQPPASPTMAEARRLHAAADYTGAEGKLREVLRAEPQSAEAHYLLASALFHQRRAKESLAEYTEGARFRDPRPEELIGVALDYVVLGDYTDADRWLTRVTQDAPQLASAWYLLGRAQYNENKPGAAEHSFLTCLQLEPRHVRAQYNLGLVYELTQRTAEAADAYRNAIAWQDGAAVKDPQPYLDLGVLLRKQGHAAEALPYLETAGSLGPRNPTVHQELALAFEQLRRYDEAIAQLRQAIALAPNVESLHFLLGRVCRLAGQKDDAAKEFAEAARLSGTKSGNDVINSDIVPER